MIHPSSVIDSKAQISKTAKVGPFCYIGPNVQLKDNVELKSNVHLEGFTKIGKVRLGTPFGLHFGVVLGCLGHHFSIFSGF